MGTADRGRRDSSAFASCPARGQVTPTHDGLPESAALPQLGGSQAHTLTTTDGTVSHAGAVG
jgi:hypothetical protein